MVNIIKMINEVKYNEIELRNDYLDEDRDIKGCELAVSDKAKCILCRRLVTIGTPRLWVEGEYKCPPPDEGIKKIRRFICYECSSVLLDVKEKEYLKKIEEGEIAKSKLESLKPITKDFMDCIGDNIVRSKIKADQIMRELEKEGDNGKKRLREI